MDRSANMLDYIATLTQMWKENGNSKGVLSVNLDSDTGLWYSNRTVKNSEVVDSGLATAEMIIRDMARLWPKGIDVRSGDITNNQNFG
jgi:hypothetical protein